ncbi:diguanylate cyclase [Marinobacteraceae bacterium S3BR75-40.1]
MSEASQRDKLKQHFAKRVTTQARVILETWQKARESAGRSVQLREDIETGIEKLDKYARRFEMERHGAAAKALSRAMKLWPAGEEPSESASKHIQAAMDQLSQCTLRRSDKDHDEPPRTYVRTPIYLAMANPEEALRIIKQMEFFGFRAASFSTPEALLEECARHKPETIVIDVNFGGHRHAGIETVESLQTQHETPIPIIYISADDGSIETRLRAARSGGEEFFFRAVDPGQLIEKIENYTHANPIEPYRVLVVDDSRAQAKFMENALNKAGMKSCIITDPMQVIKALEEFSPEIIILDMYMPGCTGMEIARVIRQQDRLHSVPIIYLSAEDDVNKQLHAMSLGGDDFLTKPIDPKHLIATIHNRGRRARSLLALMIRDSLTGLYNHTHTLHLLDVEITRAQQKGTSLTFAMLDIDFFKKINDTYGHPMGDRVLRSLSMFLKQRLRKTDHIGRYGGEEFAIILPETRESDARNVLNEIRDRFSELLHPAGDREFRVTFSCGIAVCKPGESAQQLCERADQALYEAKREGRNRLCVAPEEPEAPSHH